MHRKQGKVYPMDDWKREYEYGTLVIRPPVEVSRMVNQLREQYDPVSQSICDAHVTVTQPMLCRPSQSDWDQLLTTISKFEAFEMHYGPLNTFLPYPCIYYEIHPIVTVLEIRLALHKAHLFNLDLPHTDDFVPHMSITDGHPDPKNTQEIFDNLKKTVISGSFDCTELAFIVPDSCFHFEVYRTLPLGSRTST